MGKHRAAIALSMTALVVAVLGQTSIGNAAVGAVRVALLRAERGQGEQHPGFAHADARQACRAERQGQAALLGAPGLAAGRAGSRTRSS